jgi:hypothetical protein
MLPLIHNELKRLNAETFGICEEKAIGDAIPLIRVESNHRWCSLVAPGFLQMLQSLPDGAGAQAVRRAIRSGARRGSDWATS